MWCHVTSLSALFYFCITSRTWPVQHLKEPNSPVDYFVIGAGDIVSKDTSNKDNVPEGSSLFFWAEYLKFGGFAVVHVAVNNMTVEMMDSFGTSLYKTQLAPRQS